MCGSANGKGKSQPLSNRTICCAIAVLEGCFPKRTLGNQTGENDPDWVLLLLRRILILGTSRIDQDLMFFRA
jgi:hypothetical protein